MTDESAPPAANALTRMTAGVAAPPPHELRGMQDDQGANPARWMYERLKNYVKEFECRLDDEHELGARLVSFGHELTFHVLDMGYHGPDLITFYGRNDRGEDVQLIQHTSQLSVLLIAVKKQLDQPRRIGFVLDQKEGVAAAALGQS